MLKMKFTTYIANSKLIVEFIPASKITPNELRDLQASIQDSDPDFEINDAIDLLEEIEGGILPATFMFNFRNTNEFKNPKEMIMIANKTKNLNLIKFVHDCIG